LEQSTARFQGSETARFGTRFSPKVSAKFSFRDLSDSERKSGALQATSAIRQQIKLLPKLFFNIPRSMSGLFDLDTSAIDYTYSPYGLRSRIRDFRDVDFLQLCNPDIFELRQVLWRPFLLGIASFFSYGCPCACRRVPEWYEKGRKRAKLSVRNKFRWEFRTGCLFQDLLPRRNITDFAGLSLGRRHSSTTFARVRLVVQIGSIDFWVPLGST
jgi:hypothetical protein